MISALKAEFRKLLTVRSTYGIILFCLALLMLFGFYLSGYRQVQDVADPNLMAQSISGAVSVLGALIALVGVLLVANEYRYNTILYTLAASPRRWPVLLAKVIAVTVVALSLTLLFAVLSPLLTYLGLQLKGLDMVAQNIPYADLAWRSLFYGWGYAMLGLLIAVLVRSQVGAIVFLFLWPSTIEGLLSLVLRERATYLPFTALSSVLQQTPLAHGKAAIVVLIYLAVIGAVAAFLFQKRDAN